MNHENELIESLNIKDPKIVFIGSGPLPISSIILKKNKNYDITLIDKDKDALEVSKKLCDKLELKFNFIHCDAINGDYKNYDIIFIASMVTPKLDLVKKLYDDKLKYILIRDAKGFSQLFYEKLDDDIFKYYKIIKQTHRHGESVNNSYILERIE